MIQLCNNAHIQDMYKRIKTALIPVVGRGKIFCAPDQIGKTKLAEAIGTGSFKIFQTLLNL